MFKRVLLPMTNYPYPTLPSTIDQAVALAQLLQAELFALSLEMEPPVGLGYSHTMPFVGTMIAAEQAKAAANKQAVATEFLEKTKASGVVHNLVRRPCFRHEVPDLCVSAARFCDITLLPVDDNAPLDQWYAEGVIFGSGHPCLILPQMHQINQLQRAVIAWDGSRAAVRSITDALPLLAGATNVLVLTAAPDKNVATTDTNALISYLGRHGVSAVAEVIETGGRPATAAIVERTLNDKTDFLVMGAFGHSRLRDFILGGFTQDVLRKPPLPVFMAF